MSHDSLSGAEENRSTHHRRIQSSLKPEDCRYVCFSCLEMSDCFASLFYMLRYRHRAVTIYCSIPATPRLLHTPPGPGWFLASLLLFRSYIYPLLWLLVPLAENGRPKRHSGCSTLLTCHVCGSYTGQYTASLNKTIKHNECINSNSGAEQASRGGVAISKVL